MSESNKNDDKKESNESQLNPPESQSTQPLGNNPLQGHQGDHMLHDDDYQSFDNDEIEPKLDNKPEDAVMADSTTL